VSGWDPLLADLVARRTAATATGSGGSDRPRAAGHLDARARVAHLLDPGSFRELGALVGSLGRGMTPPAPADALVAGHGTIDGRPVVVGSEDFTVMAGSIGPGTHAKRHRLADLARRERVPLVMLLDGVGERARTVYEGQPYAPDDLQALARLRGHVPTVAVVLGVCAGHSALGAALADVVVMTDGAALFTAGPAVVAATTGEPVTSAELGGPAVHAESSGVVHLTAADDATALDLAREWLAHLPSHAGAAAPRRAGAPGRRRLDDLLDVLPADPRATYDVRAVVRRLVDDGRVLELGAGHGAAMVTALGRLGGRPVLIVANNPAVGGGAVDAPAAAKAGRVLERIGPFGLPVVFLADTPGLAAGRSAEAAGVVGAAARLYEAQAALRAPKLHVTLRRAHGLGSAVMAMRPFDAQTTALAFPGARLDPLPAESGAEAAGRAADVADLLAHAELGGAYAAADRLGYDDVIDPRDLRDELLAALELASAAEEPG
jgi:acetyl-CoA carboxylase carboxyltransferase component